MSPSVKWGVIAAVVSILFFVTGALLGLSSKWWFGLIGLAITIALVVAGVREARAQSEEFGFGRAFGTAFTIILISSVVSVLFTVFYTQVVDPGFYAAQAEETRKTLQSMGLPEDQIEEEVAKAANPGTGRVIGLGLGFSLVIGAIIAAIVGAVMKKPDPKYA